GTAAATNVHITAHTTTNQNLSKDSDASTVQTTGTNNLTYLIPKWGTSPVEVITAEAVNECVGSSDLAHLAPRTVKGIVKTLQAALGKKFGRRKISYPSSDEVETGPRLLPGRRGRENRRCSQREIQSAL